MKMWSSSYGQSRSRGTFRVAFHTAVIMTKLIIPAWRAISSSFFVRPALCLFFFLKFHVDTSE